MTKFYKIGFWLFSVVIVLLLSFIKISNVEKNQEIQKKEDLYNKRQLSLQLTNTIFDRKLDGLNCRNIITEENVNVLFQDTILVILLDKFKCSKCQENELIRLDSLRTTFESKRVNVIGITNEYNA